MPDRNKLFERFFETTPHGVWLIDSAGRTIAANAAMAQLLGHNPATMKRLRLTDCFSSRAEFENFFSQLNPGTSGAAELLHKSGEKVRLKYSAQTLDENNSRALFFFNWPVSWGLTLLDAAGLVAETIPDPFCLIDLHGHFIKWNRAFVTTTGRTDTEIAAMRPTDFFKKSHAARVAQALERALREGAVRVETELLQKSGALIPFECMVSRVAQPDGKILGYAVLGRNLTEYREAQKKTLELLAKKIVPDAEAAAERELGEIIDVPAMQSLLDAFASLTGLSITILDENSRLVVTAGWTGVCAKYHRLNPRTLRHCLDCNRRLAEQLRPGEYTSIKCERGLWNVATPLYVECRLKGLIATSQFMYEGETGAPAFHAAEADEFGFDKTAYLAEFAKVPVITPERLKVAMDFLIEMSDLVSRISFANIRLSKMMAEQKRIELALRESEHQFRMLLQSSPLPTIIINEDETLSFANDRFTSTLGYTLADVPDRAALRRALVPGDKPYRESFSLWNSELERARHGDGTDSPTQQFEVTCKTGTVKTVEARGTYIGGKLLIIMTDITERRRTEAELARHREHLEELVWARTEELSLLNQLVHGSLDAAEVGAWWINFREKDTFHALDNTAKMLGLEPYDAARKSYRLSQWHQRILDTRSLYPEYAGQLDENIEHFQGGVSGKYARFNNIFPLAQPDGTLKWFDLRADVPSRDAGGRAASMTGTLIDITRLKRSEDEIVRARETAESASRAKSEFLATMSHELRTPLNSIIGFAQVLADESFGQLNQTQREFAADIQESGKHLLSLINDILDLAKIESGKMELAPEKLALPELIENSLGMIRQKALRHNIALRTDFPPGLPPVKADEMRVRQVVYNLLSNAAKFTPDGGTITVAIKPDGFFLRVAVTDTGIGIPSDDQERIFRQFEQASARKYGGTGLGLCISRDIAELHGGRLWLEQSAVGAGSTFAFTLPLWHEEAKKH